MKPDALKSWTTLSIGVSPLLLIKKSVLKLNNGDLKPTEDKLFQKPPVNRLCKFSQKSFYNKVFVAGGY